MTVTTTNASAILRPEEVADLVVKPALAQSIARQALTLKSTGSKDLRIPRVVSDPSTGWVAEGEEIPLSDMPLDELVVTPTKVAGLVAVSREAADDTSPEATSAIGDGLARDLARKIDTAFGGNLAAPAPKGLAALADNAVQLVERDGVFEAGDNLDAFAEAASLVEVAGGSIGFWLANPLDALDLAVLKVEAGSARPLLAADPTQAAQRIVEGRPLLVSNAIARGTVYGIDPRSAFLVVRDDTRVEVDRSVYFTSDRLAVRAVMRVGFGFALPSTIARIKFPTA